jgi:hypothetical protein
MTSVSDITGIRPTNQLKPVRQKHYTPLSPAQEQILKLFREAVKFSRKRNVEIYPEREPTQNTTFFIVILSRVEELCEVNMQGVSFLFALWKCFAPHADEESQALSEMIQTNLSDCIDKILEKPDTTIPDMNEMIRVMSKMGFAKKENFCRHSIETASLKLKQRIQQWMHECMAIEGNVKKVIIYTKKLGVNSYAYQMAYAYAFELAFNKILDDQKVE